MPEASPDNRPYRKNVGMMVVNEVGQVFIARRIGYPEGAWQMPQGGIDEGETIKDAAFRELREETGIEDVELIAESEVWRSYDVPLELSQKLWDGRFRGQTQKWFLFKFIGSESSIDLEAHHPEFCEWRWASIDELPDLAVHFKRKSYIDIIKEFKAYL